MNELKSSPTSEVNNPAAKAPKPLARFGAFAAIAALLAFAQTASDNMTIAYDQMLTYFSQQLTGLGTIMDSELKKASDALADAAASKADSSTIASLNDKYQDVEIKYQNLMTPYNTQTDSWTDGVKQLASNSSNSYQYCQSLNQIMTNLSNKL